MGTGGLATRAALLREATAVLADPRWRRVRVTGEQFDWWVERGILPKPVRYVGRGPRRGVVGEYDRSVALPILTTLPYLCRDIRSLDTALCAAWVFGAPIPWRTVQKACEKMFERSLARLTPRTLLSEPPFTSPVARRGRARRSVLSGVLATMRGDSDKKASAAYLAREWLAAKSPALRNKPMPLLLPAIQKGVSLPQILYTIRGASEQDALAVRPLLQFGLLIAASFTWEMRRGRIPARTLRPILYRSAPAVLGVALVLRRSVPDLASGLQRISIAIMSAFTKQTGYTTEDVLIILLKGRRGQTVPIPLVTLMK